MKVYLDLLFITNFIFDFIILFTTSIVLKRNIRIIRLLLGSVVGSFTLIILFVPMNSVHLFLYKIVISIFLCLITFGFKNAKYFITNLYYIYLISIILGGILYLFNNQFKYNIILGIVISILSLIIFIKNIKRLKTNYNKYIDITIYFENYKLPLNAFLDTGNKLIDPYSFKPIILINKNIIKTYDKYILVPYKTCGSSGLLKCIKAKKIYINGIGYRKNFLIGLTDSINIDGINCILNEKLLEG